MRLLKILGGPFYFFFVKHFYYFRKYIYILFPKVNDCFTLTEKHGQLEKVTIYPYEEVRGSDLFSHMPQSKVKISEGAVYFGKGVDFSTMASGVYIQDRQLIPEISDIHRHDFYIKKILKPNFNVLKGKSLVLTSLYANSNYWHWTVDVIALIHLIEKMELDLNSFDNLLIYHTNLPYQDAMIKYLGIDESKVYLIDGKTSYHLEEVVVPFSKTAINQANWKVDFLNQKFVPQKVENSPKNIYISRQGSKRCIANYQNFKKFLDAENYTEVYLEKLTFQEQINLFYNADKIMGVHGAGFTNIIWAKSGTELIELMPENYNVPYYYYIAKRKKINYKRVLLNTVPENKLQWDIEKFENGCIEVF